MGILQLHIHGIVHGDLKAANILVSTSSGVFPEDIDGFHVKICDFETSVGVLGTGFWRAPEIRASRKKGKTELPTIKADVYSYAMTCYEILTGHCVPNERPKLPDDIEEWLRKLIEECRSEDPSQRPDFQEIVDVFKSNFPDPTAHVSDEIIEASKYHWTEVTNDTSLLQLVTNQQVFARLKQDPVYSAFFSYKFLNLKRGRKIAEGGEAEIFEAEFEKENGVKVPCVEKLFKQVSLKDMVEEWPLGMFQSESSSRFGFMGAFPGATNICEVFGGVVDENSGRFAFILNREGGDLRTWIDYRMKCCSQPFDLKLAKDIMYQIAHGAMYLHEKNVCHRDLKASNVLVTNAYGEFPGDLNDKWVQVKLTDFGCSMKTVLGTGFWRAPEILKEVQSGTKLLNHTRKTDVYSFAMTCYEVLTGGVPLDHLERNDYAAVYERGERPVLPSTLDRWLRDLIEKCWRLEPSQRPEFTEIIEEFEKNYPYLRHSR